MDKTKYNGFWTSKVGHQRIAIYRSTGGGEVLYRRVDSNGKPVDKSRRRQYVENLLKVYIKD